MQLSYSNIVEHRSNTVIYLANKWAKNDIMILPGATTSTTCTGSSSSSCSCGALFVKNKSK